MISIIIRIAIQKISICILGNQNVKTRKILYIVYRFTCLLIDWMIDLYVMYVQLYTYMYTCLFIYMCVCLF